MATLNLDFGGSIFTGGPATITISGGSFTVSATDMFSFLSELAISHVAFDSGSFSITPPAGSGSGLSPTLGVTSPGGTVTLEASGFEGHAYAACEGVSVSLPVGVAVALAIPADGGGA